MGFENLLKEYAFEQGMLLGITDGTPFYQLENILINRFNEDRQSPFEEKNLSLRIKPCLTHNKVKSIISIVMPYSLGKNKLSKSNNTDYFISRSGLTKDYHKILVDKLNKIVLFLIAESKRNIDFKIYVDTGPLLDRAVAIRCGLGFCGKNTCLINHSFGSWVFTGHILLDFKLTCDKPLNNDCAKCNNCLKNCPAKALVNPYTLDSRKCLSYWSQAKEFIPTEIRTLMGNRLYGCDDCQNVCPENQLKINLNQDLLSVADEQLINRVSSLSLADILTISNRDFKDLFLPITAGWRGKKIIQRNAIIAIGNNKDTGYLNLLKKIIKDDPRPEIRVYAIWALSEINSSIASELANNLLTKETDSRIISEALDVLAKS